MNSISGIYQIRNLQNGGLYIGSASNLKERKRQHFLALKLNTHHNKHLQNSYNKYGAENFVFDILFYCNKENLVIYEQMTIDFMKPKYNKRLKVETNLGTKRSDVARKNIRDAHKGLKYNFPDGYLESLSKRMLGNTFGRLIVYTEELRNKKRNAMLGKNKGKKPSQKCIEAVRLSNKNRIVSDETRKKMSEAHKKRKSDIMQKNK